jgi:GNAT superfamily N-acetyltransferase
VGDILRRAGVDDIGALAALHHATVSFAYREWFPPPPPSVEELTPLWEEDVAAAYAVFMVDDVASVVARRDGTLGRLHVHPSRWGEGLGGLLHDAAVAELRSHGHARAGLWVIEANARARRLYERRGWVFDSSCEPIEYLGVHEVRYSLELM